MSMRRARHVAHMRRKINAKFKSGDLKERDYLIDLDADGGCIESNL